MKITEQSTIYMIDLLTAKIAEMLAAESGRTITDSMRDFMTTKTYALLLRPQSYLFLESPQYILDMLDAEKKEDTERWMEV